MAYSMSTPARLLSLLLVIVATVATTALAKQTNETELLSKYSLPNDVNGATAFALLYGTPILAWSKAFVGAPFISGIGTNKLYNVGKLATPASRTVVAPNADTIYAISVLDLAHQDVVITLPPMQPDRFYLFAFYDPYGDQYAGLGSVDHNEPGEYLLRPSVGTGTSGLDSSPDCDPYKEYMGCINSPTYNGLLLIRVLAKNNGSDVDYVDSYLKDISLDAVNKRGNLIPPVVAEDFENLPMDTPSQILEYTARFGDRNPPQNPDYYRYVPKLLERAGIEDGNYTPPPSANLTEAYRLMNATLFLFATAPDTYVSEGNGWNLINPSFIGGYQNGTDLPARAAIAIRAYLANLPQYAIYPMPSQRSFSLDQGESYLFTFSSKPPVEKDGFWSVTAYDDEAFLVENSENVYQVGDRSNLTYADGSAVYPTGDHSSDGSDGKPFQILVQPSNVSPPANWTHNWLPSPNTTNTSFNLIFRLFAPQENAYNGNWQYPIITKQKSITA